MRKINWIIVKSSGRGVEYGVGTFAKNMLQGLSAYPGFDIFVVEIGSNGTEDFYTENKEGVTYFHFSKAWHLAAQDTVSNLSKHAKSILRVLQPYVPTDRETVVHLNFITQYFLGLEFKSAYNATIIFTQHVFSEAFDSSLFSFDLEREMYEMVDHLVTVTEHGKKLLNERLKTSEKITAIYNGINPYPFTNILLDNSILIKYGLRSTDRFILYSGRLDTIKGLRYLAYAFKKVVNEIPDCRLVVAGDGNFSELIGTCKEVSSNVNYLGFIPFNDLAVLYKHATIGVIPSLEEHCSYVALEMLHSGLPVVASRIGGLEEIFVNGENSFLIETVPDTNNVFGLAPDVDQMAEYMIALLNNDKLRKKYSSDAVERANSLFTSKLMVEKYIAITLKTNKL
jgi:glycosyltransferase involved in cell wall biosynthesis